MRGPTVRCSGKSKRKTSGSATKWVVSSSNFGVLLVGGLAAGAMMGGEIRVLACVLHCICIWGWEKLGFSFFSSLDNCIWGATTTPFYFETRMSCLVREPARVGWVAGGNFLLFNACLFFSFCPFPSVNSSKCVSRLHILSSSNFV